MTYHNLLKKPGSNSVSFSLRILNLSILTAVKRMDLVIWLMTLQARWTTGSAQEMGQFLTVQRGRSEFYDISSF